MSISPPKSLPSTEGRTLSRADMLLLLPAPLIVGIAGVLAFFILTNDMRTGFLSEDVRKVAAEVEAAVINDPDATSFEYVSFGDDSRTGTLVVGDSPAVTFEASTSHANFSVSAVDESGTKVENGDPAAVPGEYVIEVYYTKDWGWGGGTADDPITYESRVGEVVVP